MHSESKTNAGLKEDRDLVLSRLNRKPSQTEIAVVRDALRIGADREDVGRFIAYLEYQSTNLHEMLDHLPEKIKNGQVEILQAWRAQDKAYFNEMGKNFADQFGEEFRRNIGKSMPDFSKDFISIKNRISENRVEVRRQSKIAIGIAAGAGLAPSSPSFWRCGLEAPDMTQDTTPGKRQAMRRRRRNTSGEYHQIVK